MIQKTWTGGLSENVRPLKQAKNHRLRRSHQQQQQVLVEMKMNHVLQRLLLQDEKLFQILQIPPPSVENNLQYGFTCHVKDNIDYPLCVLCSELLANESLKPFQLKRYLQTKHESEIDQPLDFFREKESDMGGLKKRLTEYVSIPSKALAASYEVAHLVAKLKKPYTIAEELIHPAAMVMARNMHGDTIAKSFETIPMSNDTMSRRICDIANDIKCQVTERLKKSGAFSLQMDESTDVASSANLLVFARYSYDGKINEDMLFCMPLEGTCTGQDIFNAVDSKMREEGLSWEHCKSVCTDAGAMQGSRKGLKAKVTEVALHVKFTHCMIHREALASKPLPPGLQEVLQTPVKVVNFIKSRPLNTRLFATLCQEMGSEHESLLFHTEVRWLSRGRVLSRPFELCEEVRMFLSDCKSPLAAHLIDPHWVCGLAYLAGIFDKLNSLNLSLQGPNNNILNISDKIAAFQRKLERWATRVNEGNIEMFPELVDFMDNYDISRDIINGVIVSHLRGLIDCFCKYFPKDEAPERYDWIRYPFTVSAGAHLSSELQDSLLDLSSDRTLQIKFTSSTLEEFCLSVAAQYTGLSKAAMDVLIHFPSTYLCEKTFSALTCIKTKYRSRLSRVEDDLRVAVSNIEPRIVLLCSNKQAQPSH